jgi:hypothetical protein
MDDETRSQFLAISQETDDLMDQVEKAMEEHAQFAFMLETRTKVDALSARFRDAKSGLGEKDLFEVDRKIGRKVSDLQKMATKLPTPPVGKPAAKAVETEFFATRAPKSSRPPVTIGLQPGEKPRRPKGAPPKVADEIDAWCGRCMMVRTHIIAAMMGDAPAQVVCQKCGSRSRFREGPREKSADKPSASSSASSSSSRIAPDPKQAEKNALVEELRGAEAVRAFAPNERYKAGEIIEHPEFGRGKIENTLPRSLLVRFASGLKPVKLGS